MLEGSVEVMNRLGLHARAAAQLVRLAGTFRSRITLRRADSEVFANAKSILSVLALAAPMGTGLVIETEGADEQEAFDSVMALFANGFGEI